MGEVRVRWGFAEDEPAVADLLQLNGMPRWVAFEERFVVAERDGKVWGALRYRTESKRLLLGLLVVDPWAGEERLARALYAGAAALARALGGGGGGGRGPRAAAAGVPRGRPVGGGGAAGASVVRRSRSPGAGAGRGGDRRLRVAGWIS